MLGLLAGLPLLAGGSLARARDGQTIARLIAEARKEPLISQRIEFISRSLLGVRYQSNTLIGGPRSKEVFVVRDDAFDCVTFCEVVLSAASARDLKEFEAALLRIRYENGQVKWEERNHYFADWCRRAVEKKICQPVRLEPSATIEKAVDWENYGKRTVSFLAIPVSTLRSNSKALATGDVIGFVSMRSKLDFYHTGLIVSGKDGAPVLRHASQSRRRVLDERLDHFLAANGVSYVTLLRPAEPA